MILLPERLLMMMMMNGFVMDKANRAFVASLGFYVSNTKVLGWKPQVLVNNVMARFASLGLTTPAEIDKKRLGKMHLAGARFAADILHHRESCMHRNYGPQVHVEVRTLR